MPETSEKKPKTKKPKTKKPKTPRQASAGLEVSLEGKLMGESPKNSSSSRHDLYTLTSAKTGASSRIISAGGKPGKQPAAESDRFSLAGMQVSKDIADEILQNFLKEDDNAEITWSRRFGVWMSQFDWYFPKATHRNNPNPPSLVKAWAYYEHVTLPRRIVGEQATNTVMRRAEPGEHEEETDLYHPFFTPQAAFIEWGTGIDLYFISLKFFSLVLLIAGLINISSVDYFSSSKYNGDASLDDLPEPLKGTAICLNTEWVVCDDCTEKKWEQDERRYGTADDGTILVLRNMCKGAELENSISNLATLFFLLITVGIFSYYLRLREIRFDEDKVTTTDYSIEIKNPPPDAVDPEEWRQFFDQFADTQVTVVTVALDNEDLVQRMVNRRVFQNQLRLKLPTGIDLEDKTAVHAAVGEIIRNEAEIEKGCFGRLLGCSLIPILNVFNMFLSVDKLADKIDILTDEIKDLQGQKFNVTEVYVTFESEEGQRTALAALTVGKLDVFLNRTSAVSQGNLFQGRILKVSEPEEPNAIRWMDLSSTTIRKFTMRTITFLCTCIILSFAGFIISTARKNVGPVLSGPLTSIFNAVTPFIIKILMIFEPHATESSYQASLYLKITLVRWVLSAILSQIITPFTSTLGDEKTDLLPSIYAILLSDVWLTPLLRLIDIVGNVKKHILAPRAKTQEEMNLHFQGTFYNLGERYTDFTKVLFVCFFYSALFPSSFFFGAVILFFQYYVDKFCMMRIWGWTPFIGSQLAVFSRRFFFTGALISFAAVSSYVWAQFPYDNICDPNDLNNMTDVSGIYNGVEYGGDTNGLVNSNGIVEVTQSNSVVYCSQSWRDFDGWTFPPGPRLQTSSSSWLAKPTENDLTWMTPDQERLTTAYGWIAFLLAGCFAFKMFGQIIYHSTTSFFMGKYEPEGDSQHIDFSSNPEIFAYVPQIKRKGYPFPFLVCDTIDIDPGLIGWNDENASHDYYNLIFDQPYKGLKRQRDDYGPDAAAPEGRPIYSVVKHYPPKWQLKLMEESRAELANISEDDERSTDLY